MRANRLRVFAGETFTKTAVRDPAATGARVGVAGAARRPLLVRVLTDSGPSDAPIQSDPTPNITVYTGQFAAPIAAVCQDTLLSSFFQLCSGVSATLMDKFMFFGIFGILT